MSNKINSALANAWFSADMTVNAFEVYQAKEQKQEEFDILYDQVMAEQTAQMERAGSHSLFGSIVGAAIGFVTGGPGGAVAGWTIGGGAGRAIADMSDNEQALIELETDIEQFDWKLGEIGGKYQALETKEWETKVEDISETTAEAIETWRDAYYDPWYQDLIEDVAIPIATQYALTEIGDWVIPKAAEFLPHDWGMDLSEWYYDMGSDFDVSGPSSSFVGPPLSASGINPETYMPYGWK